MQQFIIELEDIGNPGGMGEMGKEVSEDTVGCS